MSVAYKPDDVLSLAEQYVIQRYTEVNKIENKEIMLNRVNKIPQTAATVYRVAILKNLNKTKLEILSRLQELQAFRHPEQFQKDLLKIN